MENMIIEPTTNAVTLEELSRRFQITRSNVRLWLLANNFIFVQKRTTEGRNHLCNCLTLREGARAIDLRRRLGFMVID
jgi:hypothetical protein